MPSKNQLSVIIIVAAVVWACSLWLLGLPINWQYTKPFATTMTVLTALLFVFDKWIWKWPIFKSWLVNQPNLHGTWKVLLQSTWIDPATGKVIAPIECIMTIRQTYSQFSARLFTRESSSYLVAHKIERHNDGIFQLFGTYQNTPSITLRGDRSEIHYGALVLEVRGDPPKSLVGHYWTDRGTKGSLELSDRKPKIFEGYKEAAKPFNLPQ
jgi:SMODS-associating 2TM, beta-strand rich effector domain